MKFFCLGLNSKLAINNNNNKKKVNNGKGMFHYLKLHLQNVFHLSFLLYLGSLEKTKWKEQKLNTALFLYNIPNHLHPLVAYLLHVLHQAYLAPGASKREQIITSFPSFLHLSPSVLGVILEWRLGTEKGR